MWISAGGPRRRVAVAGWAVCTVANANVVWPEAARPSVGAVRAGTRVQGFEDVRVGDVLHCIKVEETLRPFVEDAPAAAAANNKGASRPAARTASHSQRL